MITVGIDLAASPASTAIAVLDWSDGPPVTRIVHQADDDVLVESSAPADKIGIDCPLGWPLPFIDFVTAHRDGRPTTLASTVDERRPLAYRATDLYCMARGMRPLSVSADRIGHAAFRAAALLPRLTPDTDRSGAGRVVEAYPAGSLRRWGDDRPHGYKGAAGRDRLAAKIAQLVEGLPLRFASPTSEHAFTTSDHAFDAVVAAITARLALIPGALEPIPAPYAEQARIEGWIAIPTPGSLRDLATR